MTNQDGSFRRSALTISWSACDGLYEVHPGATGGWLVVNGESGQVRCAFADRAEAIAEAESLNADDDADAAGSL